MLSHVQLCNPMDYSPPVSSIHGISQARILKWVAISFSNVYINLTSPVPPGASLMAQMVKNLPAVQETRVWPLGWEDPLEEEMATHYTILAWKVSWLEEPGRLQSTGLQSWTWLSNYISLFLWRRNEKYFICWYFSWPWVRFILLFLPVLWLLNLLRQKVGLYRQEIASGIRWINFEFWFCSCLNV